MFIVFVCVDTRVCVYVSVRRITTKSVPTCRMCCHQDVLLLPRLFKDRE